MMTVLKFSLFFFLPLKLCFLSEVWWDNGGWPGDLASQTTRTCSSCCFPRTVPAETLSGDLRCPGPCLPSWLLCHDNAVNLHPSRDLDWSRDALPWALLALTARITNREYFSTEIQQFLGDRFPVCSGFGRWVPGQAIHLVNPPRMLLLQGRVQARLSPGPGIRRQGPKYLGVCILSTSVWCLRLFATPAPCPGPSPF